MSRPHTSHHGIAAILAGLSLVLTACTRAASAQPARAPVVPADWASCRTDADCADVAWTCCACDMGDYVAVNRAHESAAQSRYTRRNCARCPQMDCPPIVRACVASRCTLRN